jgi:hypothetical protein
VHAVELAEKTSQNPQGQLTDQLAQLRSRAAALVRDVARFGSVVTSRPTPEAPRDFW